MISRFIFAIVTCFYSLIFLNPTWAQPYKNLTNNAKPSDPDQALKECFALTQLNLISKSNKITSLKLTGDNTPFLSERLNGRVVWRVEFSQCTLKLKSALPSVPDRYPLKRTFMATMYESGGCFIKIATEFAGDTSDLGKQPSAKAAEDQLRRMDEWYTDIPSQPPKLSFLQAVDAVQSGGIGCPNLAKEIDGQYVMDTENGEKPRPVWIITLRGIPPMPGSIDPLNPREKTVPIRFQNHIRNVIDASTGKCIYATDVPQSD